jgi:ubiquinone/menaquinone biosynthesis C-methylase UbiE
MSMGQVFYMEGEERFGFWSSLMYPVVNLVPTTRRFYDFVISELNKRNFSSMLDIGSGRGTVLIHLGRMKKSATLIGIDPSPQMVKFANRSAERAHQSDHVKFMNGNSRTVDPNQKFDLIMSSLSFHHWSGREKNVVEIMKALHAGGEFIVFEITDNGKFNRKFVKSHLMNRNDFLSIGSDLGIVLEITERDGFISASFRNLP